MLFWQGSMKNRIFEPFETIYFHSIYSDKFFIEIFFKLLKFSSLLNLEWSTTTTMKIWKLIYHKKMTKEEKINKFLSMKKSWNSIQPEERWKKKFFWPQVSQNVIWKKKFSISNQPFFPRTTRRRWPFCLQGIVTIFLWSSSSSSSRRKTNNKTNWIECKH